MVEAWHSCQSNTTRMVLIALRIALLVVVLLPLLFMSGMMPSLMSGIMGPMMGGMSWVIVAFVLLVLLAGVHCWRPACGVVNTCLRHDEAPWSTSSLAQGAGL